jgi:HPt (histidine-containing phosphotransfer) domain-containing protein
LTRRKVEPTAEAEAGLEVIYERVRRSFMENLTTIDDATRHLASGALDETERSEAERAAHRLVGTAAMVGFPEATATARRLEATFGAGNIGPGDAAAIQTEADALRRILFGHQHRSR